MRCDLLQECKAMGKRSQQRMTELTSEQRVNRAHEFLKEQKKKETEKIKRMLDYLGARK